MQASRLTTITLLFLALQSPLRATATDYTVNSASDAGCNADGKLTLREVLTAINGAVFCGDALPGTSDNRVVFEGTTPYVVNVETPLPAITRRTALDGGGIVTLAGTALAFDGLVLSEHTGSQVRGVAIVGFVAGAGIEIEGAHGSLCGSHTIRGNRIGISPSGVIAPNKTGVLVTGCGGSRIGGTTVADRNIISGNLEHGVALIGPDVSDVVVAGNYIGVGANGITRVPNGLPSDAHDSFGVYIGNGASNNVIGGVFGNARNVIAGNEEGEILIGGSGTELRCEDNSVRGNFIGIDATGMAMVHAEDNTAGVRIRNASRTVIGGLLPDAQDELSGGGNFISHYQGKAIHLSLAGETLITGNVIGLGADGQTELPTVDSAIAIGADGIVRIGGATSREGNVIASSGTGVSILYAPRVEMMGNRFGFARDGMTLRRNTIDVMTMADRTVIGGTTAQRANLFAGGTFRTIETVSHGELAFGHNFIGVDIRGTPVTGYGRALLLKNERVTIDDATIVGGIIEARNEVSVRIRDSRIYGSTGAAIQIEDKAVVEIQRTRVEPGDGSNAIRMVAAPVGHEHDPLDADTGPNACMNTPVVVRAATSTTGSSVEGTIDSHASATIRIEIYRSAMSSLDAQGRLSEYLGAATVQTDPQGHATFAITPRRTLVVGEEIAAVATDVTEAGTSEVSPARAVIDAPVMIGDAGMPMPPGDAGMGDAGIVRPDGGAGDAGEEQPDSGEREADAGMDDAGMDVGGTESGCGCRVSARDDRRPQLIGCIGLVLVLWARRRRR